MSVYVCVIFFLGKYKKQWCAIKFYFFKILMPTYYIDFEAFQHGDGPFILKELCIMENQDNYLYYLFRPEENCADMSPELQQTFTYLTNHVHGLYWEEGITRYCNTCVAHRVTHAFPHWHEATFMVLDRPSGPKVTFLKNEFPQLNIVHAYNVTFNTLPDADEFWCPYRNHGKHCSFIKCCQLHKLFGLL